MLKLAFVNNQRASFLYSSRALPVEETKTIKELLTNQKIDAVIITNFIDVL